jgi:hypothetical protein
MNINRVVARAKAILLTPRTEWTVIAAEPDTVAGIYQGYILILAAIPVVCGFISSVVIGYGIPFLGTYRASTGTALTAAAVNYALTLAGTYVLALIIDALAPTFGGQKSQVQALKTVAYAYTAGWVASIIGLVPGLGILSALAGLVYGIYLLYLGLPQTMKSPPDRAAGYTVASIVAAIVVYVVISLVVGSITRMGMGPRWGMGAPFGGSTVGGGFVPGSAGSKLEAWSKNMEQAGKQMEEAQKSGDARAQGAAASAMLGSVLGGAGGKVEALPPDRIKAFIPDTLAGMPRTQFSAERNGAMGMQVAEAKATYSDGKGRSLNLEITDMGSLRGVVGVATGWAGVEQEKETDTGYDRSYRRDGRFVHEQWDKQSKRGEYGMLLADRFSVQVEGSAASVDELKSALDSIDLKSIEALKDAGVQSK